MKLKIITDSSSDYSQEQAKKLGIELIPLTFTFDDKTYRDGIDIEKNDFYEMLIKKKKYPKTSQPSPSVFVNLFEKAKENDETVLVLLIAESLSGSYRNALIAKEEVGYDKIYVVDSYTTIAGLQILVETALKKYQEGLNIEEIVEFINKLKQRIVVIACMNTLEYLAKGGRLSVFGAIIGNLVDLKPIIKFKVNGAISVYARPFGKTRANLALIRYLQEHPHDENYKFYYYYSYEKSNLDVLMDKMKKNNINIEGDIINLSPVVGTHIGHNAYGFVYIAKEDNVK